MAQSVQLNEEAVNAAINSIHASFDTMQASLNAFLKLLNEKVEESDRGFPAISSFESAMNRELQNFKGLEDLVEEIVAITKRYTEQANEAADDSAFRIDD